MGEHGSQARINARPWRLAIRGVSKIIINVEHRIQHNAQLAESLSEARAQTCDGHYAAGEPLADG